MGPGVGPGSPPGGKQEWAVKCYSLLVPCLQVICTADLKRPGRKMRVLLGLLQGFPESGLKGRLTLREQKWEKRDHTQPA